MQRDWAATIEPDEWRILGHDLGPLTWGHCVLIERLGISRIENPASLILILGILSNRRHSDARKWVTWATSAEGIKERAERARNLGKRAYRKAHGQMCAYLSQNMSEPDLMHPEGSGESRGTPTLQSMRAIALENLGYSADTFRDAPYGQLVWDIIAWSEGSGGVRVLDDELRGIMDKLRSKEGESNAQV